MIILNMIGKVDKTYISRKLGLYISNLPNDWQDGIKETLKIAYEVNKIDSNQFRSFNTEFDENIFVKRIRKAAEKILGSNYNNETLVDNYIEYLSKHMICLDIDYENNFIPLQEGGHSCFDGGSCETDPVEKILGFIRFFAEDIISEHQVHLPYCIYSSSDFSFDSKYKYIFNVTNNSNQLLDGLILAGKQIDDYLLDESDFYRLEYLCNALYKFERDDKNTYHYMKLYSLCAMFLEKKHESELDYKLPEFMDTTIEYQRRVEKAKNMRIIRNKIAHGDFTKVYQFLEEYAQSFMDGTFWFDYFEHSRNSWIISNICFELELILKKLIQMMIFEKTKLDDVKQMKPSKEYELVCKLIEAKSSE